MNQKIIGYHKDNEDHWVAELECGHAQHVRHDPPWMEREWVTTLEGRAKHLGVLLNCVRCDEMGALVAAAVKKECVETVTAAYEQAGISGLCGEGRWEYAVSLLEALDTHGTVNQALTIPPTQD